MNNPQRSLVKIIREVCHEGGIDIESFSYDWILRLSKNDKVAHIYGYQFDNNTSATQLICSDKCAASDLLSYSKVPVVRHILFMSPNNTHYTGIEGNWGLLLDMLNEHHKLVCKTNDGSGGNNVYLITNHFELEHATHKIFSKSRTMAVSPYYSIDNEFRVIVLNNDVKLIYSKHIPYVEGDGKSTLGELAAAYRLIHPHVSQDIELIAKNNSRLLPPGNKYFLHWKHNLGQGSTPEIVKDLEVISALSELAILAAKALAIKFASIDIIKTGSQYLVLEINSGIMMERFSLANDENYQISKKIYSEAVKDMMKP